ncbi:MAG: alpha/beta fold hydrolase [Proteobacteria bacterium]|nr:alpha/beta fold hydrolase [Pseudomonadota bacterium]
MRATTRRVEIPGPAGVIECAIDAPTGPQAGIALIAHPHPLHGGTLDNKVTQTLARAYVDLGWLAVRPNFRGVGASAGAHDEGRGEVDDLAAVHAYARATFGSGAFTLAGFSFGTAVQLRLAKRLTAAGDPPARMTLVGVAAGYADMPPAPVGTLVIHGELDETVPLGAVLDWARPQDLPVVVVPGADHFFHRKLHLIRNLVRAAGAE